MSQREKEARRERLAALRRAGVDPYPARVPTTEPIAPIADRYVGLDADEHSGASVSIAGRLTAIRGMGYVSMRFPGRIAF